MIYFDACYLAKYYFCEEDTTRVRAAAAVAGQVCCVEYGQIELAAVFHRKLREGSLTQSQFEAGITQFESDCEAGAWVWVPSPGSLLQEAARRFRSLPKHLFLRAGDALHLTCAAEHGFTEIYSSDKHLLAAALHFGLTGVKL